MECHLPVLSGLFFSLTDCFPVGCQTLNVLAQQAEEQSQLTGPPAAGVVQKDLGGARDFVYLRQADYLYKGTPCIGKGDGGFVCRH